MSSFTIAIDVMGGDKAPEMVMEGVAIAAVRHPNLQFLLYGQQQYVEPLLSKHPELAKKITLQHAAVAITNEMETSIAIRNRKETSMYQAIHAVKEGKAQAVVSAGNTGALMAISKLVLGTIKGIRRPAITSLFPTSRGESLMLDLGANIDCSPAILSQFSLMGHVLGKTVFGWDNPSIGLLNVGSENQKGNDIIKEAAEKIRQDLPQLNFHGFIEGNDIPKGTVDIVVTDGFTGNVALKTAEGTASLIGEFVKQAFNHSTLAKIGYVFAKPAIAKLRHRLDPRNYNGAVFLGLNHVSIKSHGGTDAMGFAAAIDVAVDMVEQHCLEEIRTMVGELSQAA